MLFRDVKIVYMLKVLARNHFGFCGIEGKYFEQKPPPVKKTNAFIAALKEIFFGKEDGETE